MDMLAVDLEGIPEAGIGTPADEPVRAAVTGPAWSSIGGCQVAPLNGIRTASRDTSVNSARAIGRRSAVAVHSVRESGPR